jgi:hypothetical protein
MMKNKIIILLSLVLLLTSLAACNTASKEPLPGSMKGYELYSWQENGQWHFTLITGTNRNKTLEEITTGQSEVTEGGWVNLKAVGLDEIKDILSRVPEGQWVSWSSGKFVAEPGGSEIKLELPTQNIIEKVQAHAEKCELNLQVY